RRKFRERSRHDQALHLAGSRARNLAGHRNLRWLRLYQRLSRRKILARCQDRKNLRRHVKYAVGNDRQAGDVQVRSEVRSKIAEVKKRSRWFLLLQSDL